MKFTGKQSSIDLQHFTESEVADYLIACGINKPELDSKHKKLIFANPIIRELAAALWQYSKEWRGEPEMRDEVRGALTLARRLETLHGLSSVITLAGVR